MVERAFAIGPGALPCLAPCSASLAARSSLVAAAAISSRASALTARSSISLAASAASAAAAAAARNAQHDDGRVVARLEVAVAVIGVPLVDGAVDDVFRRPFRRQTLRLPEAGGDVGRVESVPEAVACHNHITAAGGQRQSAYGGRRENVLANVGVAHAARLRDAARPEPERAARLARLAVLCVREVGSHLADALALGGRRLEPVVLGQADRLPPRWHEPTLGVADVSDGELAAREVEGDEGDGGARRGDLD
mmetsp:Transcript_45071/g.146425  ORF Transcript_45071/g.146425 Transcript_45071/m.146425 type:complete len:252 (+) Transcript_45071:263-1018(+)